MKVFVSQTDRHKIMAQYHVRSITLKNGDKILVEPNDKRYWQVPLEWYKQKHPVNSTVQYALSYYGKWITEHFNFGPDIITIQEKIDFKYLLNDASSKAASDLNPEFDKDVAIKVATEMINELKECEDKNKISNNLREVIQMIKQRFINHPHTLYLKDLQVINKYEAVCDALIEQDNSQ